MSHLDPVRHHVVVIDDYEAHLDVLVSYLQRADFEATGFIHARAALGHLDVRSASLVVVNLYMPEMDGIEVSRRLLERRPSMPLIGITGGHDDRSESYLRLLRALGAKTCLRKPIDGPTFLGAVRAILG
ncbi:MAG: response regulator [Proteobacteria bacterium]|nr:response regulator [Pseudomonadota bacterium]